MNPDLVEHLLKLDANVDSTDEFGFTVLHWATKNGCIHTVRALLEHGSDITITTKYKTTTLGLWMVSKDFMIMVMNLILTFIRIIPTMMMKFVLM